MLFLTLSFLFILGITLGSFASAIIYRERQELPWGALTGDFSRSFCPNCKVTLQVKDLIPLFSWVFQKGSCRYCKMPISFFYILLELFSAAILVWVYVVLGSLYFTLMMAMLYPFLCAFAVLLMRYKLFSKRLFVVLLVLQTLSIALTFLIYPIMG